VLLNLEGEIPFKGGRFVTPNFCMIKFSQARRALGCIFEIEPKEMVFLI
jgi:hypothetical protein